MERRLCTLICAMFFCTFKSIVILINCTKTNIQKKNTSKNKYAKIFEYLLHHNLRNVFLRIQ